MKIERMLSDSESETLLNLSINHGGQDVRVRGAGLLRLGAGAHPDVIVNEWGQPSIDLQRAARLGGAGVVGLIGGHQGGRPLLLSAALRATVVDVASKEALTLKGIEALTLKGIAHRVEALHQCVFPCSRDTLGAALKAQGFSFKRTRWSLKKNATRTNLPPARQNLPNSSAKPGAVSVH